MISQQLLYGFHTYAHNGNAIFPLVQDTKVLIISLLLVESQRLNIM